MWVFHQYLLRPRHFIWWTKHCCHKKSAPYTRQVHGSLFLISLGLRLASLWCPDADLGLVCSVSHSWLDGSQISEGKFINYEPVAGTVLKTP